MSTLAQWWYVQQLLPHSTGISLYACILYFGGLERFGRKRSRLNQKRESYTSSSSRLMSSDVKGAVFRPTPGLNKIEGGPLIARGMGWVAQQHPRPTHRQGCTCWVRTGDYGIYKLNCHYPQKWVARQKLLPSLGRQCIWAELHQTGGLSATLAVNRLGCCHATWPWAPTRGVLNLLPPPPKKTLYDVLVCITLSIVSPNTTPPWNCRRYH